MEIIKPAEISGKIMSLIDDAVKHVIIVSPYYNFKNWDKLLNRIEKAKQRGVKFIFYIRQPENQNERNSLNELEKLGFSAITIERLHAKIYLNEHQAIVTSMNLNESSDKLSVDIGLITKTPEDYQEINNFYLRYIKGENASKEERAAPIKSSYKYPQKEKQTEYYNSDKFFQELDRGIDKIFVRGGKIEFDNEIVQVFGKNRYTAGIENTNINTLVIDCVITGKEFDFLKKSPKYFDRQNLIMTLLEGGNGTYNMIEGSLERIKTQNFNNIFNDEADLIRKSILDFIKSIEDFKEYVYKLKF
jgi:hypothetical protein